MAQFRPNGNSYRLGADWEPELLLIRSLNRADSLVRTRLGWTPARNWRLVFGVDVFDGPALGFFGRFADNDRAYIEARRALQKARRVVVKVGSALLYDEGDPFARFADEIAALWEQGKEVVLVKEAPGFVTSRINALIGNEAFRMLQEGVASAEDIDKALKLGLNHPMGPFEMVDLVGLDVRLSILEYLHKSLGDAFRPNQLLIQHVRAGRLGRKVGRGVYTYNQNGEKIG